MNTLHHMKYGGDTSAHFDYLIDSYRWYQSKRVHDTIEPPPRKSQYSDRRSEIAAPKINLPDPIQIHSLYHLWPIYNTVSYTFPHRTHVSMNPHHPSHHSYQSPHQALQENPSSPVRFDPLCPSL